LDSHETFLAAGSDQGWNGEIVGFNHGHGPYDSCERKLHVRAFKVGNVFLCSKPAEKLGGSELSTNSHVKEVWRYLRFESLKNLAVMYGDVLTCGLLYQEFDAEEGQQRHAHDFAEYWHQMWQHDRDAALIDISSSESWYVGHHGLFAKVAFYAWQVRRLFYTDTGKIG
jgi:hypothetical protein